MQGTALRTYVALAVVAGAAVLIHGLLALAQAPHVLEWFLFALLAIVTGSFTLNIASINASIGVNDTFFITSALLFGPGPAALALAGDTLVYSWRKRHAWHRLAFNTATPALSLWIAAQAFFALSGVEPLANAGSPIGPLIVPLVCLIVLYFALNSGLMAIAVGLESKQLPFTIWRGHFLWLSQGYFASGSIALFLILI